MAIDARRMGPTQLCRLLNSTPLGEVISERQLHRHRTRAGRRIGEDRSVDLYRYVAWLVQQRHAPQPSPSERSAYDAMKEQARERNALASLSGRDIGPCLRFMIPLAKHKPPKAFATSAKPTSHRRFIWPGRAIISS